MKVEEGAVRVNAITRTCDRRRACNKKLYCLFCSKPFTKMARDFEHVHSNKSDVANACSFPKGSKRRRLHLDYIRNKANYVNSISVLKSGKGALIPYKQPAKKAKGDDFIHCTYCQGLFTRKILWRHMTVCK